jgi:hypothetical protein
MTTQALPSVVLDPAAEYRPVPGYRVVATDMEVLRAYPLRDGHVWAKGERAASVCSRLAEEDGIEYATLRPCRDWLRELSVPDALTGGGIATLQASFGDTRPVDAAGAASCVERWLNEQWPALRGLLDSADALAQFLADGVTDEARAALRWLCQRKPASARHRLVARLLDHPDPLAAWLGLESGGDLRWVDDAAGFLPQALPPGLQDRVARHWRAVLVSSDGFSRAALLLGKDVGALRKVVRREAEAVYDGKPPRERARLEEACRVLFGDDWVIRRAAQQSGWPRLDPQADVPQMLEWFRTYREKADWGQPFSEERLAAARSFQDWFLDRERFPRWCAQGERGPLSFCVNNVIRDEIRTATVLLLLVDGLGYREHGDLLRELTDQAPSLQVTRDQVVLTTLPTITAVCKGSLLSGRPQREWRTATYKEMVGTCRRRSTRSYYYDTFAVGTIIEKLTDTQTSLVAVNYTDLDRALHDASDAGAIRGLIVGKVSELAMYLAEVASAVAGQVETFAIIIASDHGQVVGPCRPITPGEEVVKQRLRPVTGQPRPFEVLLPRDQTLCTEDYYAITDDSAWDAGTRPVFGCHGGIFPEEVVTRLTAYGFRPPLVSIDLAAQGKGIAGVNGTIGWHVRNLSAVAITVRKVWLAWGDRRVPLPPPPHPVGAFMERNFPDQKVEGWPGPEDAPSARVEAEYVPYAKGEALMASGPATIESESGYEASPFEL